jgi:hypothetical protein
VGSKQASSEISNQVITEEEMLQVADSVLQRIAHVLIKN